MGNEMVACVSAVYMHSHLIICSFQQKSWAWIELLNEIFHPVSYDIFTHLWNILEMIEHDSKQIVSAVSKPCANEIGSVLSA